MKYLRLYEEYLKIYENNNDDDVDLSILNKNAALLIRDAMEMIISKLPIFSEPLFMLRIAEYDGIETMATDYKSILYNPNFVINELKTDSNVAFVLLHELLHVLNFHYSRGLDKKIILMDPKTKDIISLWNIAADYAINLIINDLAKEFPSTITTPTSCLLDEKYTDMDAEKIYNLLKNELKIEEAQKDTNSPKKGPRISKGKFPIMVGTTVRIKSTGKKGVVTKVNSDGTFEISDDLSLASNSSPMYEAKINTYKREEISPIISSETGGTPPPPGAPRPYYEDDDLEYEDGGDEDGGDEDDGDEDDGDDGKGNGNGNGKYRKFNDDSNGGKGGGKEFDTPIIPGSWNIKNSENIPKDIKKVGEFDGKGKNLKKGIKEYQDEKNPKKVQEDMKRVMDSSKRTHRNSNSATIRKWLGKLTKPIVNWKKKLMYFIDSVFEPDDVTYGRWNKRYISRKDPLYLPGIKYPPEEGFNHVIIAFDVSGSIGNELIEKFMTEVYGIFKSKKIERVTVIYCDDHIINPVKTFNVSGLSGDLLTLNDFTKYFVAENRPPQGGGTSLIPPFNWINKNIILKNDIPAFVLYFTDSFGEAPEPTQYNINEYAEKVLWVIYNADSANHIHWPNDNKLFLDKNNT